MTAVDDPSPGKMSRNWPAAAAVCMYALLLLVRQSLGWQHLSLFVLVWACLTTAPPARRFVREWWPMILFWFGYDSLRMISPFLFSRVAVEAPLRWEAALFRSPEGTIWPFYFARWMARAGDSFGPALLSRICSLIYLSHVFVAPLVFLIVWLRRSEELFQRLLWSYAALHVLTLAAWLAFPTAPPWWVYENGFVRPAAAHSMPLSLMSGSTLSALFQFNANRFAAIPSLHAAYPVLLMLVLALDGVRWRWILTAGLYAAGMWFACVFLNQHYVIDLVLGAMLVPVVVLISWPRIAGRMS